MGKYSIPEPRRILVVDDHPMIREALSARISPQPGLEVCGEAVSVDEALEKIPATRPHLAIVDLSLQGGSGIDLLKAIATRHPEVKTLVLTMYDQPLYVRRSLQAGAMGFVNKQQAPTLVIEAIRSVLDGQMFLKDDMNSALQAGLRTPSVGPDFVEVLSNRELEVFQWIGHGLGTRQIAEKLRLSVHTIESYREKLKVKLALQSGQELAFVAVEWVLQQRNL